MTGMQIAVMKDENTFLREENTRLAHQLRLKNREIEIAGAAAAEDQRTIGLLRKQLEAAQQLTVN
jgi:hypothetical protein